jgi:pheromone a factor receptor
MDPYPSAIALGFLAALVSILSIPPLVWHIRNRNIAPACLVSWLLVNNFINFLNAIIWSNDDMAHWFHGVGLCDIEVKIQVARAMALPGATLCILKSLANVMDTNKVNLNPTRAQRQRALAFDLVLCTGLPIIFMFLHYVFQPSRYQILSVSGCAATYFSGFICILFMDVPPLILVCVDAYYAGEHFTCPPSKQH